MKGDVTKLPKWAQQEIARLERSVEHWQGVASQGSEDSTVFADAYSDAPRPLGEDPVITFSPIGMGIGSIRVTRSKRGSNVIEVMANEGVLEVSPQSSNVIRVRVNRWWRDEP